MRTTDTPASPAETVREFEEGSGTVLGIGIISAMLLLFLLAVGFANVHLGQVRAQTAADLAALSGASSSPSALQLGQESSPCAVAATISELNGATLESCWAEGGDLLVQVRYPVAVLVRWEIHVPGRARAGPQNWVG